VASVAFATSCGAVANFVPLLAFLRRREGRLGLKELANTIWKVLAASAVMALVAGRGAAWLLANHPPHGAGERLLFLAAATFAGMVVYLGTAILLRATEPGEFVRLLRNRTSRREGGGAAAP
jgi:peptidoglycan biosynthesis protein MviN/MurJ (putative lipid II flippase)